MPQLTLVGAGWAGLGAAVAATQAGWQVHLYEASHLAGGRARALPSHGIHAGLDNGQHILIGAYRDTLALMQTVGVDTPTAFHRIPLDLRLPNGDGLQLPNWPAPWNVLAGVVRCRNWSWRDKQKLLQACLRWQWQGFSCPPKWTVKQLCDASGLPPRIRAELIDPLCLSALNTHTHQACGQTFLRVLHDALLISPGSSDLLLPQQDLSTLFVEPCLKWLQAHGAQLRLGHRVTPAMLESCSDPVLLACAPWDAAQLTATHAPEWSRAAEALKHEAIATVYLKTTTLPHNLRPMVALPHKLDAPHSTPAQFVFNRERLLGQRGLLAAVVSACQDSRDDLAHRVCAQVQEALQLPQLEVVQTIVEKRATLRLTPELQRPQSHVKDQWWACGDYIAGPYPSTLEGAVRCGHNVVAQLIASHSQTHATDSSHV